MKLSPCATRFALPLGLLLLVFATPAAAQVGSALVAVPWQPDRTVNATAYYLGLQTDSETLGVDTNLTRGVSFGRSASTPKTPPPRRSAGSTTTPTWTRPTRCCPSGWSRPRGPWASGSAKSSTAGTPARRSGSGSPATCRLPTRMLGTAWAASSRPSAWTSATSLTFILDFDGSRAIWPDVPLPGIQYSVFESPSLRYSLGLPFSTFYYKPDDKWLIDIQYILPIGGRANIEYQITDQWVGFASYSGSTRGYHLDGDGDNRRLSSPRTASNSARATSPARNGPGPSRAAGPSVRSSPRV